MTAGLFVRYTHRMESGEALWARVRLWNTLRVVAPPISCDICRSIVLEVRDTAGGALCLPCWLELPPCDVCGSGPGVVLWGSAYYCPSCLNPDPTPEDREIELERAVFTGGRTALTKIYEEE